MTDEQIRALAIEMASRIQRLVVENRQLDRGVPTFEVAAIIAAALRQVREASTEEQDEYGWHRAYLAKEAELDTLRGVRDTLHAKLSAAEAALLAHASLVQEMETLIAEWRENARQVRPLESAPLTAEKRARTAEWMHYTNRANELDALLRRSAAPVTKLEE